MAQHQRGLAARVLQPVGQRWAGASLDGEDACNFSQMKTGLDCFGLRHGNAIESQHQLKNFTVTPGIRRLIPGVSLLWQKKRGSERKRQCKSSWRTTYCQPRLCTRRVVETYGFCANDYRPDCWHCEPLDNYATEACTDRIAPVCTCETTVIPGCGGANANAETCTSFVLSAGGDLRKLRITLQNCPPAPNQSI